jgi:hypothetical protein
MGFGSQPGDPLPWAEATGHEPMDDESDGSSPPAVCEPGSSSPCVHCEITSETVMPEPADRSRTTIGVGERVSLTFSLGNATWQKSSTQGRLSSDTGTTIVFTAPSTAQSVTITATGGGCTATIVFTVVAPIECRMTVKTTLHDQNTNKIGMTTNIFLAPHNVNFHWVEDMEDEVMCTATGVYACNDNTGHGPKTTPSDYTTHVVHGYGTRGVDNDTVASGFCDGGTTQGDGRISLRIPNRWRVKGTSTWRNYLPANQACSSTAAGQLRASKAGAVATSQFSAAGSNYPP